MTFNEEQKRCLSKADRLAIRQAIPRLKEHWGSDSWLSSENPYCTDIREQIKEELQSKHLSEYIAASAIVHCFDGWSYLGRALEAEMSGDKNAACHLSYYAELRAAMSLLASEGIGVVDREHIIVTKSQKCIKLPAAGTHKFAWDALEIWVESSSADVLFQVIKPGGIPLQDWLRQFDGGIKFVAQKWLLQWGLDLSQFSDDQKARNLASYRPSSFVSSKTRTIREIMTSISELWEICDPGGSGGFPILDRYLLRISLRRLSKGLGETTYRRKVKKMLNDLGLSSESSRWWNKFLNEREKETPQIIQDADGKDDLYCPNYSKQILARATLLLRVATGLSADLLNHAGSTARTDLEFWLQSQAVRRRLWAEKEPVGSFPDLWQDVEVALESIEEWMGQNGSVDHYSFWKNRSSEASILTTTERACLWGLGL